MLRIMHFPRKYFTQKNSLTETEICLHLWCRVGVIWGGSHSQLKLRLNWAVTNIQKTSEKINFVLSGGS